MGLPRLLAPPPLSVRRETGMGLTLRLLSLALLIATASCASYGPGDADGALDGPPIELDEAFPQSEYKKHGVDYDGGQGREIFEMSMEMDRERERNRELGEGTGVGAVGDPPCVPDGYDFDIQDFCSGNRPTHWARQPYEETASSHAGQGTSSNQCNGESAGARTCVHDSASYCCYWDKDDHACDMISWTSGSTPECGD